MQIRQLKLEDFQVKRKLAISRETRDDIQGNLLDALSYNSQSNE